MDEVARIAVALGKGSLIAKVDIIMMPIGPHDRSGWA